MKNRTIQLSLLCSFIILATVLGGCKKTDPNFAASAEGVYYGKVVESDGTYQVIVTLKRLTDATATLDMSTTLPNFPNRNYCFKNVSLSSASAFSFNEVDSCRSLASSNGTGTISSTVMSMSFSEVFNGNTNAYTITATK